MPELKKTKAWGIAALVLGILSLLLFLAPYLGLPLAIAAVVFHHIQKKHEPTGAATGGLVTGIIGIVINSVMLLFIVGLLAMFGAVNEVNEDLNTVSNEVPVTGGEVAQGAAATDKQDYIKNSLSLSGISVGKGYGQFDTPGYDAPKTTVEGKITNSGEKSLDMVEITIYFLNEEGKRVGEKTYTPINTYAIMGATTPLKPGYEKDWGYVVENDAPSSWAKKVEVSITNVDFS